MNNHMIIDFHTHIFPDSLRKNRQRYLESDATFRELFANPDTKLSSAEELVKAMDEDGVDMAVVMGIGWSDHGLASESNDYIIDSVNRYPDRIIGFAGVNPSWNTWAAEEADRCARAGLSGIGELHPDSQEFDLGNSHTMAPLMVVVKEHSLVVTTHSSEPVGHMYNGKGHTTPEVLWRFVQNFPDTTLVCSHWGGGLPFYALMPEVSEALSNVYFDTAASPFLYKDQVFEIGTSLVGSQHILLGSDYPLLRSRRLLSQIKKSGISNEGKAAISGGNAIKVLNLH